MLAGVLAAAVLVGVPAAQAGAPPAPSPQDSFRARVVYVSDGDTFGISSRKRGTVPVRIIGVDTPETKRPDAPVECYGRQATRKLRSMIDGTVVTLAYQRERRDRFGRDLLDVWTESGRFVAGTLVGKGFGRELSIWPNTRYEPYLERAEKRARSRDRGLWSQCSHG